MGLKTKLAVAAVSLASIVGAYSIFSGSSTKPVQTWYAGFDKEAIMRTIPKGKKVFISEGCIDPFEARWKIDLIEREDGSYEMRTSAIYKGEEKPAYEAEGELLVQPPEKAVQLGFKHYIQKFLGNKKLVEIVKDDKEFEPDYSKWSE